jgi:hypothetical protein
MESMSLKDAAEVLGISEDGVRKRVKRGSIPHNRDEVGKLYVYLDASETEADASGDAAADAPVSGRPGLGAGRSTTLRERIPTRREPL